MVEGNNKSKLERLRNGEVVHCEKCGKGVFIPYATTADKAHYYDCSNSECDNYVHCDPQIDIE